MWVTVGAVMETMGWKGLESSHGNGIFRKGEGGGAQRAGPPLFQDGH